MTSILNLETLYYLLIITLLVILFLWLQVRKYKKLYKKEYDRFIEINDKRHKLKGEYEALLSKFKDHDKLLSKMYEVCKDGKRIEVLDKDNEGHYCFVYRILSDYEPGFFILNLFSTKASDSSMNMSVSTVFREDGRYDIEDIKIWGPDINRGFGTIFLKQVEKISRENKMTLITGTLEPVDFPHRDRQIRFYEKNGFQVELFNAIKRGRINKQLIKS